MSRTRRFRPDLLFDLSVGAAGAAVGAYYVTTWATGKGQTGIYGAGPARVAAWVAVALVFVLSRFPLTISRRGGDLVVGFEAAALVFLAMVETPSAAVALWAVANLVAQATERKQLSYRVFNVGITMLAGAAAVALISLGGRQDTPAQLAWVFAGAVAYFLVDLVVTAASLELEGGGGLRAVIPWSALPLGVLCFLGVDAVGYLGALLVHYAPGWSLALLVVPVAAILVAVRTASDARIAQRRLSGLLETATAAHEWQEEEHIAVEAMQRSKSLLTDTEVEFREEPPRSGELGAQIDRPGRSPAHLVARREGLGRPFGDAERQVLQAVAALASAAFARNQLIAEMSYLARHDALTGLANRAVLTDRLEHALNRRRPRGVSVLYCDLDGFKAVNDRLGHEFGDRLLTAAAGRIRACLRPEDTAARLGGDEFAVLLEGSSGLANALAVADRLLVALAQPFQAGDREVRVSVSIGIAHSTAEGTADDLLRDADTAMYQAKARGRSRAEVFRPSMRDESLRRMQLEDELRRAVRADALNIALQPIVDLSTGDIEGFEALARWTHPALGPVSPEVFIPLAEQLGLIRQLGMSVLEKAHRAAQSMHEEAGRPFWLSINVSAAQVGDPILSERIAALMSAHPQIQIVLELTESSLIGDDEETLAGLGALTAAGASLAVDDFGVGYSSMSYLQRLPVQHVKIDKSFLRELHEPRATALVRAIIAMAGALNLQVVAEGVEDAATARALRALGTRLGQGFLFSRPVTPLEAVSLARTGRVEWGGVGPHRALFAVPQQG